MSKTIKSDSDARKAAYWNGKKAKPALKAFLRHKKQEMIERMRAILHL